VTEFEHVKEWYGLEGVVTNVTAFGEFVDIVVHQDGLVHVSNCRNRFVRDPAEVVKTGDRLKVRVLNVDKARRRIASAQRRDACARSRPWRKTGSDVGEDKRDSRAVRPPRGGFSVNPFAGL
jgi:uncharacterized protein